MEKERDLLRLQGGDEKSGPWTFAIADTLEPRIEGRPPTINEIASALRAGLPLMPLLMVDVLASLAVAVLQRDALASQLRMMEPDPVEPEAPPPPPQH